MTTDPLVSTKWLADHLHDKHVKVVDASFKMPGVLPLPKEDYERAHIPGAVFFDVDAVVRPLESAAAHVSRCRAVRPRRRCARRQQCRHGRASMTPAAGWRRPRAWWMFLAFGHDKVRVLDGGLKKWLAEGHPVQGGNMMVKPATFKAKFDARRVRSIAADDGQSRQQGRAGDRRAGEGALRGQRRRSRGPACAAATSPAAATCPTIC